MEQDNVRFADQEIPGGKEHILLIDDEKALVHAGKRSLESLGYKVTATTNVAELLEIFYQHHDNFDLVITDQTMPTMDGLELAQQLLCIRPDLPIILCTGYSPCFAAECFKDTGIRDFLAKPFDKAKLAKVVRQVLDASG